MAKFEDAIPVILKHEGGLSNDKADPGGTTKYGISLRYLRTKGLDYNHDGKVDANDIREMKLADAIDLYHKDFWIPMYDLLTSQIVATKIFDFAVNAGPEEATLLAQRAVNRLISPTITEDGAFGPKTAVAINKCSSLSFVREFRLQMEEFYKGLVAKNPNRQPDLKGWLRRAAWPDA